MSRAEYVQHLLDHGCLIQKKNPNGMWVMYNPDIKKRAAIAATDPALSANICRVCESLEIPLPDDSTIYAEKDRMMRFHAILAERESKAKQS